LCEEYPYGKYNGADLYDSFITHKNQFRDLEKAKRIGIETYKAELNQKIKALEKLLKSYDDGRRKSFFCLAVNLLDRCDLKSVIAQLSEKIETDIPMKEKAMTAVRLIEEAAGQKGISLQLRRKVKS